MCYGYCDYYYYDTSDWSYVYEQVYYTDWYSENDCYYYDEYMECYDADWTYYYYFYWGSYYYEYYYRTTSFTKITVLDLTNRSSPQVSRELYIEGDYQTARESEGTVRMVSYGWMEIYGLKTWLEFDYSRPG